jgi:hypothetical protein
MKFLKNVLIIYTLTFLPLAGLQEKQFGFLEQMGAIGSVKIRFNLI